jgi:crotonobetainyl-CoA:carnitine CoA-transferase CaiB-like acyl-CoA transferase
VLDGLLAGTRVLDLTIWRPGPYATQLLAETGADVVKVEPPGGDPMRRYPELFASLNANKRSVVLDLKSTADRHRALELAGQADVFVEGFRPGVVDRLGVGPGPVQAANPRVVYCSISGMGQTGPLRDVPGHDLNYQAWAGTLAPDGGPAVMPSTPVADLAAGVTAAFAICAALVRRSASGEGERIDVAIADVLATWTGAATSRSTDGPAAADATAGAAPHVVPGYGVFDTADGGQISLGVVSEDHFWRSLCDVLGLVDQRELGFGERLARGGALQDRISTAVAQRVRDQAVADLLGAGVPAAPVLDRSGMLGNPHFRARGAVVSDPWADPAAGFPVTFAGHPARRTSPPPGLDEHRGAGFLPFPVER